MRWVRTTLPWTSMTVTATGTPCSSDSASTRSAMSLAMVSRSMVVCFLSEIQIGRGVSALAVEAELSHVDAESILRVATLLESLFQQGTDLLLRGRSPHGGHAGVPA